IWYPQSEACLTLNVIRGSSVDNNSKLPVAVWIHGGGFVEGSGREQRYNRSAMIENSYRIVNAFLFVLLEPKLTSQRQTVPRCDAQLPTLCLGVHQLEPSLGI